MKQKATYTTLFGATKEKPKIIEYDDEQPCKICGEPILSISMSGTAICPWCDRGKCRYCGMTIFAIREEIDGGASLKELREHMKWHKGKEPERPQKMLEVYRHLHDKLEAEAQKRINESRLTQDTEISLRDRERLSHIAASPLPLGKDTKVARVRDNSALNKTNKSVKP